MDYFSEYKYFQKQLKSHADAARAEKEKDYLKSNLKFYGVDTPTRRTIIKEWMTTHEGTSFFCIVKLAEMMWDSKWYEERSIAISLLAFYSHNLTLQHMPMLETMIHQTRTWAELDEIAISLVGAVIDREPKALEYLPKWAQSDNFWVRRAAILAQIVQFRRGEGDITLFEHIVVPMFAEGDDWSKDERFFIRKAIGWALRELCKNAPDVVAQFAAHYKDQMAGLTYREATRRLPDNYQEMLPA